MRVYNIRRYHTATSLMPFACAALANYRIANPVPKWIRSTFIGCLLARIGQGEISGRSKTMTKRSAAHGEGPRILSVLSHHCDRMVPD